MPLEAAPRREWVKNAAAFLVLLAFFLTLAWAFSFKLASDNTADRIGLAFWGLLPLAVIGWYSVRTYSYLRGGRLLLTPSTIEIQQPALWRGTLRVQHPAIRRFDIANQALWEQLGLMTSRSPFPSLDAVQDREPNAILVLDPAVPAPKRLRRKRSNDPLPGEHIEGFRLRLRDPETAAAHLRAVGIEPEAITEEESIRARLRAEGRAISHGPPAATSRREALARQSFSVGALGLLGGIIVPYILPVPIGVGIAQIAEYKKVAHGLALLVPALALAGLWIL